VLRLLAKEARARANLPSRYCFASKDRTAPPDQNDPEIRPVEIFPNGKPMREQIRYSWGQSTLGDFIAAVSNEGLVAFEFVKRDGNALNERASSRDVSTGLHSWPLAGTSASETSARSAVGSAKGANRKPEPMSLCVAFHG
jgi:hypothetical protein